MARGPGQPAPGPARLTDSLARHRWITAAGMTATLAAVAGGGAALAFHGGSVRPPKGCGLVPCAAALPASVRSGDSGPAGGAGPAGGPGPATGTGAASAPATAAPTAVRQPSAPPSLAPSPPAPVSARPVSPPPVSARPVSPPPVSAAVSPPPAVCPALVSRPEPFSSPALVSSAAGRAVSADHAIGVGYAITEDSQQGIHGQIVIVNNGSAPVSGWRVTLVLPGDRGYQVLDARNRSAGDALVMTAPADGRSLGAGGTELIAFTARGTTSRPVRSTFTAPARPRPASRGGSGAAVGRGSAGGGQARDRRREGWPLSWLGGWLNGGWTQGDWPSPGGPGSGWAPDGRAGHHHGWPGGR